MTTPEIRYVAEIDRPGHPYTGPAMCGTERVTVGPGRKQGIGCILAATSSGWTATGILRAVVSQVTP